MLSMSQQSRPPLPAELWEQLPEVAQALILALQAQIQELEARVRELEARVGQNSQNSSQPPSSDPPAVGRPKRDRPSSGRKPGGQPGHRGHYRNQYPNTEVAEVVALYPACCQYCGAALESIAEADKIWCHQVVELPEVKARVTEYQLHSRRCQGCGRRTVAQLPPGVPRRPFGPRLQATTAMLTGRYRLSRREARQLLGELWQVQISLGGVSKLEAATFGALEPVVEGVAKAVREAGAVNVDETGWSEGHRRSWLWTAVTEGVSLFHIDPSRGGAVLEKLLGKDFQGVVGTDRYSAYNRIPVAQRELCHAHLKRNFQALVDRGGPGAAIGQWALKEQGRIFALWHRFRDGEIDRQELQRGLKPIKARFGRLLERGKESGDRKADALCWELSKLWEGLWTFARVEGVEPTNNAAERALRPGVLWRKGSFGSQSEGGSGFVERLLTVAGSCRQQQRQLLSFLEEVCRAALSGAPPPSLLAQPSAPR
jgi:transposase